MTKRLKNASLQLVAWAPNRTFCFWFCILNSKDKFSAKKLSESLESFRSLFKACHEMDSKRLFSQQPETFFSHNNRQVDYQGIDKLFLLPQTCF